jgi:hypothetical protein
VNARVPSDCNLAEEGSSVKVDRSTTTPTNDIKRKAQ